ncbi:MAG: DUF502 domain-containing protein [Proteobacteria bacterium]|nr:DUF502 domain-containing protein [Pseudomonadota bacterium]MCP4921883.1 DUF502 domain-containing protein [Pseudomonadota bacterium]
MSNFLNYLRNTFLAGLAVLIPAGVTFWVVVTVAGVVDSVLDILPEKVHPEHLFQVQMPGLGILISVIVVLAVGAATRFYVGQRLVEFFEWVLSKVPVLSAVYQGLKKLVDTLFGGDAMRFQQVVMVEYPRRGAWAIAFLTGEANFLETGREFDDDQPVSIFLPTTPNPTSGFYLVLPARDVRRLDITVEEAFKIIMSAGIVMPDEARRLRGLDDLAPFEPKASGLAEETIDAEQRDVGISGDAAK